MSEYEDDAKINENRLKFEWQQQSQLMMKWGKKYALAVTRRNRAEQNLKIVRAEAKRIIDDEYADCDDDIRRAWKDYGFTEKPTDKAIEQAIKRDKEYKKVVIEQEKRIKEATDEFISAVEEEQIYGAAKTAMVHKKKSLEELTALFFENYNSEPRQLSNRRSEEVGRQLREGPQGRNNGSGD